MEQLKATETKSKQAAHQLYNAESSRPAFEAVSQSLVDYLKHTPEGEQAIGAPLTLIALGADLPNVLGTAIMYGYKLRVAEEQIEGVKPGDCTCVEHKKLNCPECN